MSGAEWDVGHAPVEILNKGSLPIEKVPNFREFSRTGGGGGSQKKVIFPTFFKNCLEWANSSRNAKKIFSIFI